MDKQRPTSVKQEAGLCENCANARHVESSRGSVFLLCELSRTRPEFPKYPRLPVLHCTGYTKRDSSKMIPY